MSTEFLKQAAVEARRLMDEEKIVVVLRAEVEGVLVHCYGQQKIVDWGKIEMMQTNPILSEIERSAQIRRERRDFLAGRKDQVEAGGAKANAQPLTETEWNILNRLEQDQLEWGAAVSAVWPNLVAHGYVKPNFGPITQSGIAAVQARRNET